MFPHDLLAWLRHWHARLSQDLEHWQCQNCETWNGPTILHCEVCGNGGNSHLIFELGSFIIISSDIRFYGTCLLRACCLGAFLGILHFLASHSLFGLFGMHLRQYLGSRFIIAVVIGAFTTIVSYYAAKDFAIRALMWFAVALLSGLMFFF